MKSKLPLVAIVGRPNVGKSALFNRLAGKMIAIVHDQAGVTRDRNVTRCSLGRHPFEIIDTGGIGSAPDPDFARQTHAAAQIAIDEAAVILFIVDAKQGVTPSDLELAKELRKKKQKLLLVMNKADHDKMENTAADFAKMGFSETICVSAAHGRGISQLVEEIEAKLEGHEPEGADEEEERKSPPRLTIIGRPNVGKSSLINAILKDERTIVSDIAGTTRDSVDIHYTHRGKEFILCDTAGIRHRSRHDTSVEVFSVMRSEKAIERAELCILVVDAQLGVTSQDKRIASLIEKAGKACLVILNKWDLVKPSFEPNKFREELVEETKRRLFFLDYAPIVVLSAKEGEALPKLFREIAHIEAESSRRISTGVLNRLFSRAMEQQPPPMRMNRRLKILYATQGEMTRPFQPARFVLFVNDGRLLEDNYRKYLQGMIRGHCPYAGIPVHFELRAREERAD